MNNKLVKLFLFSLLLYSCGPSAEEKARMEKCIAEQIATKIIIESNLINTFDAPFPKRNRSLKRILGDTLQIEGRCKPETFRIVSTRKLNYIIDVESNDTLFKGTVCKYRGLYYLNEKINDTTYRIFALKITDSLIYGLQNYFQYAKIDSAIERGEFPKLVKYIDKNKKLIRLHPEKKELKSLFATILNDIDPFVIIRTKAFLQTFEEENSTSQIETDDFETLSKVYPNPAKDIINVELQHHIATPYYLSDNNGKVITQGEFQELSNKIDLTHFANGTYALTILSPDLEKESVKIIKAD